MILQMIPAISTNFWGYTLMPLSVIIGLGVVREGWADLKRHQQDKRINNTPASKIEPISSATDFDKSNLQFRIQKKWCLKQIKTMDIQVGDIIMVRDDETVPADCVLLATDQNRPN